MTLTIVYDNNAYNPKLQTDWGFACLIEWDDTTLLFDTGGKGDLLLSNITKFDLDPGEVDVVVLSHIHGDHTGGLNHLLATGVQPLVYVPRAFPDDFKAQKRLQTELVEVDQANIAIHPRQPLGGVGGQWVRMKWSFSRADSPRISDSRPEPTRRENSICQNRSWAWT